MRDRLHILTMVAVVVVAQLIGLVSGAAAQDNAASPDAQASPEAFEPPQFVLFPVGDHENLWFEVTANAGESVELRVGIQNTGSSPVALRTYAANAFNPPNGGFAAGTEDEGPAEATLWIAYPATTFELQPGSTREIDFVLSVPHGTVPGEYVTGLVVETADTWEIPGSENLRQIIRNTVSVEITVPGDMTSGFELGDPVLTATGSHLLLDIPITNTGTARVRPHGEVVLTTMDGDPVATSPMEMGSVYGGQTTSIVIVLPEHVPTGEYLVSVDLEDEATGETASMSDVPVRLDQADTEEAVTFTVESVSITPNADPIQFANVQATISNNGQAIPTATVMLNVQRDGEEVESYPLAQNQALPQGSTEFTDRYIPIDGWEPGSYTFEFVISAVSGGTETILATIEVENEIVVP